MRKRASDVVLREVVPADLPILFEYQNDPEANLMAAVNARDDVAFAALWHDAQTNPEVTARVIVADGVVVGHIATFLADGERSVGYWIGREHWGRGCASRALAAFLEIITTRPLHASIARTNIGSQKVLERCGFEVTGYRDSPATERYLACEEATYLLR
jgi:RimJ/RimL family protein N-acetyltransferase